MKPAEKDFFAPFSVTAFYKMHWKTLTFLCLYLTLMQCLCSISCSPVKLKKNRKRSAMVIFEVNLKNGMLMRHAPNVGCYGYTYRRQSWYSVYLLSRNAVSITQQCINKCRGRRSYYAVLRYQRCYCFDNLRRYEKKPNRYCDTKCRDETTLKCGGYWGMSVYQLDLDECTTGRHNCEHRCINTYGSFRCSCKSGYYLDSDRKSCCDINECLDRNGGCSQKCLNFDGGYRCSCKAGYVLGHDRKTCSGIDIKMFLDDVHATINECLIGNGGCDQNCINYNGVKRCSCKRGYRLGYDRKTCRDINECLYRNGGCGQKCLNYNGGHSCSCKAGYILRRDRKTCRAINECLIGNGGCDHNCINYNGGKRCSCKRGYRLEHDGKTCRDINECLYRNGGCGQKCLNYNGGHSCSCKAGYILRRDRKTCRAINECLIGNGGCDQNCINYNGGKRCSCKRGYRLEHDGKTCRDINECLYRNGGCGQKCLNYNGGHSCSCKAGYILRRDRKTCRAINECLIGNGGCDQNCINYNGGKRCSCKRGYRLEHDGKTCRDVNECLFGNGGCDQNCINYNRGKRCSCKRGYRLANDGKTCRVSISAEVTKHVCEWGSMTIDCGSSATIMITAAMYGRLTRNLCNRWYAGFWSTNCRARTSFSKVKERCEGKRSCTLNAVNDVFGDPCWRTGKYLQVSYRCKG